MGKNCGRKTNADKRIYRVSTPSWTYNLTTFQKRSRPNPHSLIDIDQGQLRLDSIRHVSVCVTWFCLGFKHQLGAFQRWCIIHLADIVDLLRLCLCYDQCFVCAWL